MLIGKLGFISTMSVLLLKSLNDDLESSSQDHYVQRLRSAGFTADVIESLRFEYLPENLSILADWRNKYSAVIFTSPRSLRALKKCKIYGKESDLCFVVGRASAELACELHFDPKGAECGDSHTLAEFIVNNYKKKIDKPVLFVTGEQHLDDLPRFLDANGIKVDTTVAYVSTVNKDSTEKLRLALCEGASAPDYLDVIAKIRISDSMGKSRANTFLEE
ncbi:unnamed protein product [Protopolystoma xenopodis]|uniref:Tetrapyrrole biosynthesis uroporphyrinogen III synthase domain-containing protein n=1 Tax=Protopolystoma xenopodis TaxID=117903 RepID=A0A3S5AIZ5_9PLAT|nr:unnamed protein product [Protopolystoma xenopodis]